MLPLPLPPGWLASLRTLIYLHTRPWPRDYLQTERSCRILCDMHRKLIDGYYVPLRRACSPLFLRLLFNPPNVIFRWKGSPGPRSSSWTLSRPQSLSRLLAPWYTNREIFFFEVETIRRKYQKECSCRIEGFIDRWSAVKLREREFIFIILKFKGKFIFILEF